MISLICQICGDEVQKTGDRLKHLRQNHSTDPKARWPESTLDSVFRERRIDEEPNPEMAFKRFFNKWVETQTIIASAKKEAPRNAVRHEIRDNALIAISRLTQDVLADSFKMQELERD